MTSHCLNFLILFCCSYGSVLLLGLQSKIVMNSQYLAAIITSFFISVTQFMFIKFVTTGGYITFLVAALGGCCGIASAIWIYDNVFPKIFPKKDNA